MAQNLLLFYKFQVNFQETFISVILYIVVNWMLNTDVLIITNPHAQVEWGVGEWEVVPLPAWNPAGSGRLPYRAMQ